MVPACTQANVVWAYATLEADAPGRFMTSLAGACIERMGTCKAQELASISWSFARLRAPHTSISMHLCHPIAGTRSACTCAALGATQQVPVLGPVPFECSWVARPVHSAAAVLIAAWLTLKLVCCQLASSMPIAIVVVGMAATLRLPCLIAFLIYIAAAAAPLGLQAAAAL